MTGTGWQVPTRGQNVEGECRQAEQDRECDGSDYFHASSGDGEGAHPESEPAKGDQVKAAMWKDDAFRFAFLLNQESPLAFGMEKLAQPHSSSFFQAQQGVTDAV